MAPTANNFLMQFQAGIRGRPIVRPVDLETTALGAAYLTGLAAGVWNGIGELGQFWRAAGVCGPRMSADERESLYAGRPELSATIPSPVESKG